MSSLEALTAIRGEGRLVAFETRKGMRTLKIIQNNAGGVEMGGSSEVNKFQNADSLKDKVGKHEGKVRRRGWRR